MEIVEKRSTDKIIASLKGGQTVVFPTETTYGLGCDANNQTAVNKIFQIKGRRSDKPLLVVVPNVEMAREYLEWNDLIDNLAKKYWPGSLTIVGKFKIPDLRFKIGKNNLKSEIYNLKLSNGVIVKDGTVAVRVTAFEFLQKISGGLGRPVVATSANLSDAGEIYSAEEIKKVFSNREFQPDILVEAGELSKNSPTTIVSVVNDKIEILRQGGLTIE